MTYQVFVGNIGTVYSGDDRDKAHATYRAYVNLSDKAYGRGAREVVSLMENGNTIEEFNPPGAPKPRSRYRHRLWCLRGLRYRRRRRLP
jgi:hypothetical protein